MRACKNGLTNGAACKSSLRLRKARGASGREWARVGVGVAHRSLTCGEALQQHRDNGGVQIRANGSRLQVHLVLHTHGRLFGALGLRGSRARIQMQKVRSSVQKKKDARRCGHHSGAAQGRKGGGRGVFGAALVRTSSESSAPAPASGGSSVGGAGASSRGVSSIFYGTAATLGGVRARQRGVLWVKGREENLF